MAHLNRSDLTKVQSFAEAQKNSKSYQDPELVKNLTDQYRDKKSSRIEQLINLQSSISGASIRKSHLLLGFLMSTNHLSMNVADIGGGNGYMRDWIYGIVENEKLSWTVYESEEIVSSYKMFEEDLNLKFIPLEDFNPTQDFDLTILSCVLQYLSNWEEVLDKVLKNSKNVLIMRTPVIEANEHEYFIQTNKTDIYGKSNSSWPFIMFSKSKFEAIISGKMRIKFREVDSEETFPHEINQVPMATYFLHRD